jgi:hypothetical protein
MQAHWLFRVAALGDGRFVPVGDDRKTSPRAGTRIFF